MSYSRNTSDNLPSLHNRLQFTSQLSASHGEGDTDVLEDDLWLQVNIPGTTQLQIPALSDAAAQGVQPDQIIFTDVAMKNEHIRRSALADLFLDT